MRIALLRNAAIVLCLTVLLGGCNLYAEPTPLVVGPNGETATPTLNATQRAIAVMLTETRAAPTITLTPVVTPTITPSPTATTPPLGSNERPVRIGERAATGSAAITVLSAKTAGEAGRLKAAEGTVLLDVEAVIENTSKESIDYTPLYFRVEDAQGRASQPATGGAWPAMQSGTLQAGEWARGHITFEITAQGDGTGMAGLRLRFSPQTAAGTAGELWIDLSQPPAQAALPTTSPVSGMETGATKLPATGQRDEAGGIALSIAQVSSGQQVGSARAGKGNVLVSLMATIENVSRVRSPFNPDYFSVKDANGYEYPAVIIPLETMLQGGSLGQGQKVSGQVVFEVPESTARLVVEYQPQVLVEAYPVIRFLIDVPK